ncbi:MAG: hypothetical protein QOG77_2120 [Solirubrobacteraceae bacterium]|jgi:hypothetical protein|nr:hypothetical protein [Solirubrobacteraceae bacterium]
MRRLSLSLLAVVALAPTAHATTIKSGTITPGRGLNGATLGMTRAEVIDQLGKPSYTNANGLLEYSSPSADIFDLFLGHRSDKLNLLQLAMHGSKFKLADGNAVYAKGGLKRLFRHYHKRLHKNPYYQGERSYSLYGKFHGRKVVTVFSVTKYAAATGRVYQVVIAYR